MIDKGSYLVRYSEDRRQPIWVEYAVMCNESTYSRKGLTFYPEKGVLTSTDADYLNNEWDRGHMAPAADFACDSLALLASFSYINCALQQENLNRGPWRQLEARERELAESFPVLVKIEVLFDGPTKTLPSGAHVPSGFRKTVSYVSHEEVYEFKNVKPTHKDPFSYLVSKK